MRVFFSIGHVDSYQIVVYNEIVNHEHSLHLRRFRMRYRYWKRKLFGVSSVGGGFISEEEEEEEEEGEEEGEWSFFHPFHHSKHEHHGESCEHEDNIKSEISTLVNDKKPCNPVSNAVTITTEPLTNSEIKDCVDNGLTTNSQDDGKDSSSQIVMEETTSSISQTEETPLSWNAWLSQSFWKLFGYLRVC